MDTSLYLSEIVPADVYECAVYVGQWHLALVSWDRRRQSSSPVNRRLAAIKWA